MDADHGASHSSVINMGGETRPTEDEEDEGDAIKPLPERLVIELTAHRTLALRDAVANNPRIAMTALLHKLAIDCFVSRASGAASLQAKGVRLVPDLRASGENAPSHRVLVGRAEIGAAWTKKSNEGREYLGLKLDDPSFAAPIYANLFDDEDGEGSSLIWSRPNTRRGD